MGLSLIGAASCWRELPWPRLRHSAPSRDRLRAHKPLRSIRSRMPPSPEWARALPTGPRHQRKDHRGLCQRMIGTRCLFLGMAAGQHLQPAAALQGRSEPMMRGAGACRAAQSARHAHRLHRSGRAPRSPVPTRTWSTASAALALDISPVVIQVPDFGDRFWVYQMVDLRTDSFVQLGKMYGTTPGFYLLVGPNWQRRGAEGHHQGLPLLDQHRPCRAAHRSGRHAGGQARDSDRAAPAS